MNTSTIHIFTFLLPIFFTSAALVLLVAGLNRSQNKFIRYGLIMLILNGIITTFTSAMGGASIKLVKSVPTVQEYALSIHAWTGMAVFLLSLLMGIIALVAVRKSDYSKKIMRLLFILIAIFMVLFVLTSILAADIRG